MGSQASSVASGSNMLPTTYAGLSDAERRDFSELRFSKKCILARRLAAWGMIEFGRISIALVTLGLSEISRATAGSTHHWWIVLRATIPEGSSLRTRGEHAYYVAQFGAGLHLEGPEPVVDGRIFFDLDAVQCFGFDPSTRADPAKAHWVQRPTASYGKQLTDDPSLWKDAAFPFKRLEQIEEFVRGYKNLTRPYHPVENNCQHFCAYIYDSKLI